MKYYNEKLPKTDAVAQNLCFLHKSERLKLEPDDLIYIKASVNYSTIFAQNQTLTTSFHIGFLEESLRDYPNFIRINKSYLINLDFLAGIIWHKDTKEVQLHNGVSLPISRRKAKGIRRLLYERLSE